MRHRRLVVVVLASALSAASSFVPHTSPFVAELLAQSCTPAPTGIPPNAGTGRNGPLAQHIYTLRIPNGECHPNPAFAGLCRAGGDTLPVGDPIIYLFSVFDTGSTILVVNNQPPGFGDTDLLGLCSPANPNSTSSNCDADDPLTRDPNLPANLDVRLWGLGAVDPVTLGAPLDTPQREVTAVQVRPSFNVVPTLIGAPVAARNLWRDPRACGFVR